MSIEGNSGFTIFTQDGCKPCALAKATLIEYGYAFEEINFSSLDAGQKQAFLSRFEPEDRTVPKVYLNGILIGGCDDLVAFMSNPLAQLVLQDRTPDPIFIQRLSPTAIMPTRGSEEAVGIDMYADLGFEPTDPNFGDGIGRSITVSPGVVTKIGFGWSMKAPRGHYLRIAPRSGLALKGGIDPLGGVVDRDYRGEVAGILVTHTGAPFTISHGDRVAQIIAEKASIVPVIEVAALGSTDRGVGGFGSTGH